MVGAGREERPCRCPPGSSSDTVRQLVGRSRPGKRHRGAREGDCQAVRSGPAAVSVPRATWSRAHAARLPAPRFHAGRSRFLQRHGQGAPRARRAGVRAAKRSLWACGAVPEAAAGHSGSLIDTVWRRRWHVVPCGPPSPHVHVRVPPATWLRRPGGVACARNVAEATLRGRFGPSGSQVRPLGFPERHGVPRGAASCCSIRAGSGVPPATRSRALLRGGAQRARSRRSLWPAWGMFGRATGAPGSSSDTVTARRRGVRIPPATGSRTASAPAGSRSTKDARALAGRSRRGGLPTYGWFARGCRSRGLGLRWEPGRAPRRGAGRHDGGGAAGATRRDRRG
jgi:hypothetical protein